jgi:hypothetical protein
VTVDLRRDDMLVMAAAPIDVRAAARRAGAEHGGRAAPALLTARFERGALEPRRPSEGVERRSTLGRQ